jgi:1-deoxy-D-xylulose-5-phosphate synthase
MVLLSKVPNMVILAPSSYDELGVMLHDALEITTGPVAIRYPKTMPPTTEPDEVGHGLRGRKVRSGRDVCILAVGKTLAAARDAAATLAEGGIETTVWDVRAVKPLDPEMLADAATHRFVVTVEDGLREGGAGAAIVDALAGTDAVVRTLGVPAAYLPHGKPDAILASLGLDAPGIARACRELCT